VLPLPKQNLYFMIEEILRTERKAANLTQKQLAEKSGISFVTINRIEGGSNPRISVLNKIFAALGKQLSFSITTANVG
jgi:transcriptional regulator with XRE-family HTH domain